MSCYHPLKGFKIGVYPSGKPQYKITSYDAKYVIKNRLGEYVPSFSEICSDSISPRISDFIDIPCGKCIGCLLDKSRDWATRCMLEADYHEHNSFITLTYNDDHLPESREMINDLTGEISESPFRTLQKRDFQLFMKRLRKRLEPLKIRYFACGEYGSKTFRPHYHAIIFGYDFPDKKLLKTNFRGDKYYVSDFLSSCWSDNDDKPIGNVLVTDISFDTCAYVARYCLKKQDNDLSLFYDIYNLDKEFTLMSRKPGIGRLYYDDNKRKIYEDGRIILSDYKGARFLRTPKYYDKLYDIDYPSDFEKIKEDRKEFVENRKKLELSGTDLDYLNYLKVKEEVFHNKTKIFNERSRNETSI